MATTGITVAWDLASSTSGGSAIPASARSSPGPASGSAPVMVIMAEHNDYETAYLLSADGDLTPAVKAVREKGKKVFVASSTSGARLAAACDSFIRLPRAWFE